MLMLKWCNKVYFTSHKTIKKKKTKTKTKMIREYP